MNARLSKEELDYVRDAIIKTSRVKYQDFYEEIYDHYLTSIETQMAEGKDFEAAFVQIHGSFLEYQYTVKFVGTHSTYYGLEALEMEYFQNMQSNIRKRHWQILKSYFRWPTIITTFLVGVLAYLFTDFIAYNPELFPRIFVSMAIIPLIIMAWYYLKISRDKIIKKREVILSTKGILIGGKAATIANLINIFQIPQTLFDFNIYTQSSIPVLASILFAFLIYLSSYWQLYKEQYDVKPHSNSIKT